MSSEMPQPANSRKTLLVDTNVWVDYYLGHRPGSTAAFKLLECANAHDCTLAYAATSVKDLFFLLANDYKVAYRKTHGGELTQSATQAATAAAWAAVDHLSEIAAAVCCDQSDIWMARKQRPLHNDFEDDLVIAAAMRAKALCLVTNDEQLLRHCPVAALDVPDAITLVEGLA